jgi:hypothetical protein
VSRYSQRSILPGCPAQYTTVLPLRTGRFVDKFGNTFVGKWSDDHLLSGKVNYVYPPRPAPPRPAPPLVRCARTAFGAPIEAKPQRPNRIGYSYGGTA